MKVRYLLTLLIISFLFFGSVYGQGQGELFLDGNKLKGNCENKYYSGFEIEMDTIYQSLDSLKLFGQLPRLGKINFKNKAMVPTEFHLTERAGYAQIIFRFRNDWITFDDLKIEGDKIKFSIDIDPDVPPTADDVRIVQLAKEILSEEKYWSKTDDRNCENDVANKCYSIYCAIKIASITIENKYNHRNAVLQKLRHLINEKYPNKKWSHRLMDYNNLPETKYEDIIEMLDDIESSFDQILGK